MNSAETLALKRLLETQQVAALGTLHGGEPAVSMVPYALLGAAGFVIHVSRLATHTADLQRSPAVGLLVVAPPGSAPTPQQLQRASVQGDARACPAGDALYDRARAVYLARFPDTAPMFGFGDFSLFVIGVRALRFVAGFAAAHSMRADGFAALFQDAA